MLWRADEGREEAEEAEEEKREQRRVRRAIQIRHPDGTSAGEIFHTIEALYHTTHLHPARQFPSECNFGRKKHSGALHESLAPMRSVRWEEARQLYPLEHSSSPPSTDGDDKCKADKPQSIAWIFMYTTVRVRGIKERKHKQQRPSKLRSTHRVWRLRASSSFAAARDG